MMALSETVIVIFAFISTDIARFDFPPPPPLPSSVCHYSSELRFRLLVVLTEFITCLSIEFSKKQTKPCNYFSKQYI